MSAQEYGGIIIPKEIIFEYLSSKGVNEAAHGIAIVAKDFNTVDVNIAIAYFDPSDQLTRVPVQPITEKLAVHGKSAPFRIAGRVKDYIFLSSDTTNLEQPEKLAFAYFPGVQLERLLNSDEVTHLLITGGDGRNPITAKLAFTLIASPFPKINRLGSPVATAKLPAGGGGTDGEPAYYNGLPCPPYWILGGGSGGGGFKEGTEDDNMNLEEQEKLRSNLMAIHEQLRNNMSKLE
ncbi:MAG: hypothetical protein AAFO07_24165 [Bacteroidota bacterium]